MIKITFWTPYPHNVVPSQRFRFESYVNRLDSTTYQLCFFPFYSKKSYEKINSTGSTFTKILILLKGMLLRWRHLIASANSDFVFIHREATPVGPPIFEWLIKNVLRKKIIYDFDDAIWLTDANESALTSFLKWRSKVGTICRMSYRVSCGNEYLSNYARKFNDAVIILPTTIDMEQYGTIANQHQAVSNTVGWSGSNTTLKYLEEIIPILAELQRELAFPFLLICNTDPYWDTIQYEFIKWNAPSEVQDLARLDIGLMPLPDDPWTRGKCGLKALQYMALGIPVLASPVGVNKQIIQADRNGYLCSDAEDWKKRISFLLQNQPLRHQLGKGGIDFVKGHYSVSANSTLFLSLFE